MPLDPKRAQAVFGAPVEGAEASDRAAVRGMGHLAGFEGPNGPRDDASAIARGASDLTIDSQPDPDAVTGGGPTREIARHAVPAISGYEILGELGRGGMGVVYHARQIRLNRPCVLKMILAGAHAGAEAVARFLAEAEAVARLQHPNIVQIHHIGEADGLPYFELEYVDGGSLDRRLDGTPWPARPAAELVEALARGRRRGAPPGHRPPRPEAGQRPAGGRRHAQDHRLRPGQVAGRGLRPDADRLDHGLARLHGPRAGRGQDQAGRAARPTSTPWGRSSTSC